MNDGATDHLDRTPPADPAESKLAPLAQADIDLFFKLATYCASSYHWTLETFEADVAKKGMAFPRRFERQAGPFGWRLLSLATLPINLVVLLFSFSAAVVAFVVCVPIAFKFLKTASPLFGFFVWPVEWLIDNVVSIPLLFIWDIFRIIWDSFWAVVWYVLATDFAELAVPLRRLPGPLLGGLRWIASGIESTFVLADNVVRWTPVVLETWIQDHLPAWLFFSFLSIRYVAGGAAVGGFVLAVILLLYPKYASARAYGFVDPKSRSAFVVFCGSTFWDNLTINANVWRCLFGLHHFGFRRAWIHICPKIKLWLGEIGAEIDTVVTTGHSLGGALAQIAALDLTGSVQIRRAVSFGSSRIGGRKLRLTYNASPVYPCTFHLTHNEDVFPRLPPALFFKHVGRRFMLSPDGVLKETTPGPLYRRYREMVNRETEIATSASFEYNGRDPALSKQPDSTSGGWRLRQTTPEQQAEYHASRERRAGIASRNREVAKTTIRSIFSKQMSVLKKMGLSLVVIFGYLDSTYPYQVLHKIPYWVFSSSLYVYGLLWYYGRVFEKGMARDHMAGRYRDTLEKRATPVQPVAP
jgi:lipase (class 3)